MGARAHGAPGPCAPSCQSARSQRSARAAPGSAHAPGSPGASPGCAPTPSCCSTSRRLRVGGGACRRSPRGASPAPARPRGLENAPRLLACHVNVTQLMPYALVPVQTPVRSDVLPVCSGQHFGTAGNNVSLLSCCMPRPARWPHRGCRARSARRPRPRRRPSGTAPPGRRAASGGSRPALSPPARAPACCTAWTPLTPLQACQWRPSPD